MQDASTRGGHHIGLIIGLAEGLDDLLKRNVFIRRRDHASQYHRWVSDPDQWPGHLGWE